MDKEKVRKLAVEELDQVAGGFRFDSDYYIHKRDLNIKCPVCGAEGTLQTMLVGWDGYADGSLVAVDNSKCTSCGAQVNIEPERGRLVVVNYDPDTDEYSEQVFPFVW